MKRICLFAGYDKGGRICDYVIHYAREMARIADVYYWADCPMEEGELEKLKEYVKGAYAGRHGKYDFGSWQKLVQELGWERIAEYDQLVLCNDSCHGPLLPLESIFRQMEEKKADFWGMAQNLQVARHLQSFFMVFNKRCLVQNELKDFLLNVKGKENSNEVVLNYETTFTQYMEYCGYSSAAYVSASVPENLSLFAYNLPVSFRFPFIKVKGMKKDPIFQEVECLDDDFFRRFPDYPSQLIESHLNTPGIAAYNKKTEKDLLRCSENLTYLKHIVNLRTLVHLHLSSPGQIPYFLGKLRSLSGHSYDVVVTMTEEDDLARKLLTEFDAGIRVITMEPSTSDVSAFMKIIQAYPLEEYAYVIKLHTLPFAEYNTLEINNRKWNFHDFRNSLVEAFLGSEEIFNQCMIKMAQDDTIALINSAPLTLPQSTIGRQQLSAIREMTNDSESAKADIDFFYPKGGIFLVRTSSLLSLRKTEPRDIPSDLWECLLGLRLYSSGYKILGTGWQSSDHGQFIDPGNKSYLDLYLERAQKKRDIYKRRYRLLLLLLALSLIVIILTLALLYSHSP